MRLEMKIIRLQRWNPAVTLGQRFTWVLRDRVSRAVVLSGYASSRRRAKRVAEVHRRQREARG